MGRTQPCRGRTAIERANNHRRSEKPWGERTAMEGDNSHREKTDMESERP